MHENSKYEAKKKLARPVRSQVKEFFFPQGNASLDNESLGILFPVRHHLLVIINTQNSVVNQVKFVSDAESLMASLTGEALQVIDVFPGAHHHLKGGNCLAAYGAEAFCSEQP